MFEMDPPRPRAAVVIVVVAVFVWELVADFLLSLLSLVTSPFLSSCYPCLASRYLSLFPFMLFVFFFLISFLPSVARAGPLFSSSSVFPLWFADTPPSRLQIGVTKDALSVSVGWSGDPD